MRAFTIRNSHKLLRLYFLKLYSVSEWVRFCSCANVQRNDYQLNVLKLCSCNVFTFVGTTFKTSLKAGTCSEFTITKQSVEMLVCMLSMGRCGTNEPLDQMFEYGGVVRKLV